VLVSITLKNFLAWGVTKNGKTNTTKYNTRQLSQQCPQGAKQRYYLLDEWCQAHGENQEFRQVLGDS
jgi:hypothetical protein